MADDTSQRRAILDSMPVLAYTKLVKQKRPAKPTTRKPPLNLAEEKAVIWYPDKVKDEIRRNWTLDIKREVGFQLGRIQQGLDPDHYREMPSIGSGVREIKLQDENKSQYRLIYVAKFEEGIYAFHVITKKTTEQTDKSDIEIARKRYKEIVDQRKKGRQQ